MVQFECLSASEIQMRIGLWALSSRPSSSFSPVQQTDGSSGGMMRMGAAGKVGRFALATSLLVAHAGKPGAGRC
jgi:hypothetical protein